MPVRPTYDNTNRSSAQLTISNQVDVTTSMVKAFQQQALLSNILMSMPVFSGEKNLFDPLVTVVKKVAKLSYQDPIDVVITKLTGAPLQVATCL